jgi:predicted metal-dependent hydrolase
LFGRVKPKLEKLRTLQELRLLIRKCETESEKIVGKKPTSLRLKPMKSQWGSCNSKGIIAINTKLMYLPERLVAYIVHHEVVHLKIHRHDRSFRQMVEILFPDRLTLDKQLHTAAFILREAN